MLGDRSRPGCGDRTVTSSDGNIPPSILPSVPMADHLSVVQQLRDMQERASKLSSVVDALKSQIGTLHGVLAERCVELAIANSTIEQQAAKLAATEAK